MTGGELSEGFIFYLDTVIAVSRKTGLTLEEVFSESRDYRRTLEVLNYVAANW